MNRTYRNPRWGVWDFLGAVGVLMVLAWFSFSTAWLYNPTDVIVDNYEVTVTRSYPLHPPFKIPVIRYRESVRPVDGGRVCVDTAEFRYRDNGEPSASWSIEEWAAGCMAGDFIWSAWWQAKLWGVIPLRPVELTAIVRRRKP